MNGYKSTVLRDRRINSVPKLEGDMKKAFLAATAVAILALNGIHAEAQAGPPPGWIHVDAAAGCVFGNAPHHWFKPSGDAQAILPRTPQNLSLSAIR